MLHPSRHLAFAIALVAGLLLSAGGASAQSIAATGNATLLAAITFTENVELDFGRIVSGPAGSVVVTQAGTQTCVTVTCFDDADAALFTVSGTPATVVNVTTDANYSLIGPGAPMLSSTDAPLVVTIGIGGSSTFNVGGTLAVGASQTTGAYAGTYNISVAYQ